MVTFLVAAGLVLGMQGTARAMTCPTSVSQRNALMAEANAGVKREEALVESGQYAAAEPLVRRQLSIYAACEGPRAPNTGGRLVELGRIIFRQVRYEPTPSSEQAMAAYNEAGILLERGIKLTNGYVSTNYTGSAWCDLGLIYSHQNRADDAARAFIRGMDMLNQGRDHKALCVCYGSAWDGLRILQPFSKEVTPPETLSTLLDMLYEDLLEDPPAHDHLMGDVLTLSGFSEKFMLGDNTAYYLRGAATIEASTECVGHVGTLVGVFSHLQGVIPPDEFRRECRELVDEFAKVRPELGLQFLSYAEVRAACGYHTFEDVEPAGVSAAQYFKWTVEELRVGSSRSQLSSALAFAEDHGLVESPVVTELLKGALISALNGEDESNLTELLKYAESHDIWTSEVLTGRIVQATVLVKSGRSKEAWREFQRVRSYIEPTHGTAMLWDSLNRLGLAFNGLHLDHRAIPPTQLALKIAVARHESDRAIMYLQRNLAIYYENIGRTRDSEALYLEAGNRELEVRAALAEDLFELGALRLAEYVLLKGLGNLHGDDADVRMRSLTHDHLARIQIEMGDLDSAEANMRRAAELRVGDVPTVDPIRFETALTGALLAKARGDVADEERYLKEGIAGLRPFPGAAPLTMARLLTLQGDAALQRGEIAAAEGVYEEAISVIQAAWPSQHPSLVEPLYRMALVKVLRGDLDAATTLLERAHAVAEAGEIDGVDPIAMEVDRARLLYVNGKADLARQEARNLVDRSAGLIRTDALTERESRVVLEKTRGSIDLALSLSLGSPDAVTDWAQVLLWKGLVGDLFGSKQAIEIPEPTSQQPSASARAISKAVNGRTWTVGATDENLHAAFRTEERRELGERLGTKAAATMVTPQAVCARLSSDTALIDLFRYQHDDPKTPQMDGEPRYVAFVVQSGRCAQVTEVDLGPAAPIEGAVERFAALLANPDASSTDVDRAGRALADFVWVPTAGAVAGSRRLLIAPDGALSALSWGALPVGSKRYLIEDFRIRYLESARDLLRTADERSSRSESEARGLLLVGAIDYNGGATDPDADPAATRANCTFDDFIELPGTKDEINVVEDIFRRSSAGDEGLVRLEGSSATELRTAAELPRHRFVHIATHGFYPNPACMDAASRRAGEQARLDWANNYDPMARSGLAMAGANATHIRAFEDGRLTANELSGLDLRGVETVVLSACGSALGASSSGEGLLGIRRALSLGGVENLVLTTTPVSDEMTVALMARFYEHLLAQSEVDPAEALRAAQLEVLADQRLRFGGGGPQAWGAFIVTGAPPAPAEPSSK